MTNVIHLKRRSNPILNALSTLMRNMNTGLFNLSPDGNRNYNTLYGYPDKPSYEYFYDIYRRSGFGHIIIDKVVKSCWRDTPECKIDNSPVLEAEIQMLEDIGFFKGVEKADILNRIGGYSVLLLGLNDGEEANKPVNRGGIDAENIYFNAYGRNNITVSKYDMDQSSPRFGMPEIYALTFDNRDNDIGISSRKNNTIAVHHERIIHLSETALENELLGMSYLEPIVNSLIDVIKVRGGAAESFFKNSRQKFGLSTKDNDALDEDAREALQAEAEAFQNEQRDFMRLMNMDVQEFQSQLTDSQWAWKTAVMEISGYTGIPMRVLTGEGAGQLAGSEDRATLNGLVSDRQKSECTPILKTVLKRFNEFGIVDSIPESYEVEWPPQEALNTKEQTEINSKKASTIEALARARSVVGGDEIDLRSALNLFDMSDIDLDNSPLPGDGEPEDANFDTE